MSARLGIGLLVALLTAGALAAAVALGLGSGSSEAEIERLDSGEPILVATSLSPPVHRLGDIVVAQLDVTLDSRLVDPGRIVVRAQFMPYELVGDADITRLEADGHVMLQHRYRLQCLTIDCVREESPAQIMLPQALVSYLRSDTNRGVDLPTSWPAATIVARTGEGAGGVPAEATLARVPEATYAIDPSVLSGVAIGLAMGLVAVVAGWTLVLLRPRLNRGSKREGERVQSATPDSLSGALERVSSAQGASAASQSLALEALAFELDAIEDDGLAPLARRLAWSSEAVERRDIDELLAAARKLEGES